MRKFSGNPSPSLRVAISPSGRSRLGRRLQGRGERLLGSSPRGRVDLGAARELTMRCRGSTLRLIGRSEPPGRVPIDFRHGVHRELRSGLGVTLQQLWVEYREATGGGPGRVRPRTATVSCLLDLYSTFKSKVGRGPCARCIWPERRSSSTTPARSPHIWTAARARPLRSSCSWGGAGASITRFGRGPRSRAARFSLSDERVEPRQRHRPTRVPAPRSEPAAAGSTQVVAHRALGDAGPMPRSAAG